jgi:hypothetical protein
MTRYLIKYRNNFAFKLQCIGSTYLEINLSCSSLQIYRLSFQWCKQHRNLKFRNGSIRQAMTWMYVEQRSLFVNYMFRNFGLYELYFPDLSDTAVPGVLKHCTPITFAHWITLGVQVDDMWHHYHHSFVYSMSHSFIIHPNRRGWSKFNALNLCYLGRVLCSKISRDTEGGARPPLPHISSWHNA